VCDCTVTFTLCAATSCSNNFSRTFFMTDERTGLAVASPSSQSTGTVGGMLPSSPSSRSSLRREIKYDYECRRFRPSSWLLVNKPCLFVHISSLNFLFNINKCTYIFESKSCLNLIVVLVFLTTMQQSPFKNKSPHRKC
jgi:hypothetical protein